MIAAYAREQSYLMVGPVPHPSLLSIKHVHFRQFNLARRAMEQPQHRYIHSEGYR